MVLDDDVDEVAAAGAGALVSPLLPPHETGPFVTVPEPAISGDEPPMLSMEELKREMFRSLQETGTIEHIRAQLRRRFIEKLRRHGHRVATQLPSSATDKDDRNNDEQHTGTGPVDDDDPDHPGAAPSTTMALPEQVACGLIHEFLTRRALENTLAVFVPEIGGAARILAIEAITELLGPPGAASHNNNANDQADDDDTATSVLTMLIRERLRRATVQTMSSSTQTALDGADHRLALENELRRVESAFLVQTARNQQEAGGSSSTSSFEERILRYQREYDALCERRLEEDLERFRTTELGLARVEERRRFERELESLRLTLFQEHRARLQRLDDRERELELAHANLKTELEAAQFTARQELFQELDKARARNADLVAREQAQSRELAVETKRLRLWESALETREANLTSAVDAALAEKDKALALERMQAESAMRAREELVAAREQEAQAQLDSAKQLRERERHYRDEIERLEATTRRLQEEHEDATRRLAGVEEDKRRLEDARTRQDELRSGDKHDMQALAYANARLEADKAALTAEIARLEDVVRAKTTAAHELELALRKLQEELVALKLTEATAVVDARKRFMAQLEEERGHASWREHELLGRLRELESRVGASEALAEKYQTQYEDEKLHVETLRHEVQSLNALLLQAQASITAKHGPPASSHSSTTRRSGGGGGGETEPSERMLLRMMEMMTMMAATGGGGLGPRGPLVHPTNAAVTATAASDSLSRDGGDSSQRVHAAATPSTVVEDPETTRLQQDVARRERELLEQREQERRRREREEQEAEAMATRRREFEAELERQRQERLSEDARLEEERRQRRAAEETRVQEELEKQRLAMHEAAERQKRLLDEQIAHEQERLREEAEHRRRREELAAKEAEEMAARRRQLQAEEEAIAKRREEAEALVPRPQQLGEEAVEDQLPRHETAVEEENTQASASFVQFEPAVSTTPATTDDHRLDNSDSDVPVAVSKSQPLNAGENIDDKAQSDAESEGLVVTDDDENEASMLVGDEGGVDDVNSTGDVDDKLGVSESNATEDAATAIVAVNELPAEDAPSSPATLTTSIDDADNAPVVIEKTAEELEEEKRRNAEETKKKEDENFMDVYRQRVLARKAAEKQRQQEEEERRRREEEEAAAEAERVRRQKQEEDVAEAKNQAVAESENELELSGGSFAESSAASSSGSF